MRVALLAAHPQVVDGLSALVAREFPHARKSAADIRPRLAGWCQRGAPPLGFVALHDGAAVGVACLEHGAAPGGAPLLLLSNLAVTEPFRGRGIGRRLCRTACNFAGRQGWPAPHAYTETAMPFFGAIGWRFVTHAIVSDPGEPRVVALMTAQPAPECAECISPPSVVASEAKQSTNLEAKT